MGTVELTQSTIDPTNASFKTQR